MIPFSCLEPHALSFSFSFHGRKKEVIGRQLEHAMIGRERELVRLLVRNSSARSLETWVHSTSALCSLTLLRKSLPNPVIEGKEIRSPFENRCSSSWLVNLFVLLLFLRSSVQLLVYIHFPRRKHLLSNSIDHPDIEQVWRDKVLFRFMCVYVCTSQSVLLDAPSISLPNRLQHHFPPFLFASPYGLLPFADG